MPAPAGATSVHGLTAFLVFSGLIRLGVCQPHQAAPAVYMIGDSLVDVGNNNYLPLSIAKANFPHNGVDYPAGKPTGRFSNGQNAADFLAKKMGLPTSPPFLSLTGGATPPITGVSFASGGAGILNGTGELLVKQSIPLAQQVDYFALVRDQLVQQLGPAAAQTHLSKSLFAIVIGSNDLFAYFTIGSIVSNQFNPQQYVDLMTSTFRNLLKTLYGMGARKVMVAGVGEIGCCPVQRKLNKTGECNVELNYWSAKYNDGLKIMLESLKSDSPGMNYAYFDTYGAMANLFQKPDTYGFMEIKEACCGLGNLNADVPCIPISRFCSNRKKYVFWDLYHPTEAVSSMFSDLLYSGSQEYTFPMNVKQLLDI
ncbi:GDSL esterase/lipase At5g55050-like [Cynara cardunculus var. scolymus]|uniref:GDSL esterase/lipase At5g55050-like n=1 Tax=Cynara cardunculus var. scolymus TaxID=59895 RepID=UPI000D6234D4|nr:GDSL esterase/lipase At5g55050-like [Cynara cardunculus var. scolymus]